jgi:hypothetical protein
MNPREEQEQALHPYSQGELESPFLEDEFFAEESEDEGEAHLAALEAESPFRHAFEQRSVIPFEPEELEEEFVEQEEWAEAEDFLLDEVEDYDDEALADLEENIEEYDEDELDEDGSYDEEFDDEELLYAEREGVDFSAEDLFLDEEVASSEELLGEVEDEEGSDYLDEVTDVQEAPALDETFFTELELEQGTGAATLRARIVEVAKQEWEKWGRGTLIETNPDAHRFLLKYWMEFRPNGFSQTKAEKWIKDQKAWSAIFISYVMREAGAGRAFTYGTFHTTFIAAAKKAALAEDASSFQGYPISAVRPEVGDLVCRDRSKTQRGPCSNTNWDNVAPGLISHSDIVVEVFPDYIIILGGNTGQSYPAKGLGANTVGQRKIRLDEQGYVIPDQSKCKYFAIVKPPAVERLTPAPSSASGSVDLLPTWLSERVKSGLLTLQAAWAMLSGQRDVNTLTNMIFYAHHSHLPVGYKIKPHEKQLAESWVRIRDNVVKPILRTLAAGVPTGSSPRTVPAPSPTSTITPAQPSPRKIDAVERKGRGFKGYGGGRLEDKLRRLRQTHGLKVTDTEIELFRRIAAVETGGRVNGINSWDSAYMSMGFMQWTIKWGEIQKLVERVPETFRRYGIEIEGHYQIGKRRVPGIKGAPSPDNLRQQAWADRFFAAGLDPEIIVAEVEKAQEELKRVFERVKRLTGLHYHSHFDELIVRALIAQLHNNRTAYVKPVVTEVARRAHIQHRIPLSRFVGILVETIIDTYRKKEKNGEEKARRWTTKILNVK